MKILIVTYTYPPAKSVNGFRPYHFAKALTAAGWKVSVLTRHFTGNEEVPEAYRLTNKVPLCFCHFQLFSLQSIDLLEIV